MKISRNNRKVYVELFIDCGVVGEECGDCLADRVVTDASKDD